MSLSSRSQVARIYTYSGGNDAGYASGCYVTDGTRYFCRVTETRARERLTTGQIDGATAAVLEFADEIVVPTNALVAVNGVVYRITGLRRRPVRRVTQYDAEWLDQPVDAVESIVDGSWTLDGSRLLNGLNPSLVA